jgi:hypothetical protein
MAGRHCRWLAGWRNGISRRSQWSNSQLRAAGPSGRCVVARLSASSRGPRALSVAQAAIIAFVDMVTAEAARRLDVAEAGAAPRGVWAASGCAAGGNSLVVNAASVAALGGQAIRRGRPWSPGAAWPGLGRLSGLEARWGAGQPSTRLGQGFPGRSPQPGVGDSWSFEGGPLPGVRISSFFDRRPVAAYGGLCSGSGQGFAHPHADRIERSLGSVFVISGKRPSDAASNATWSSSRADHPARFPFLLIPRAAARRPRGVAKARR